MKALPENLRNALKKPVVRYLLLFAAIGSGLYFVRQAPCEVKISVDLDRVHRLGDGVLSRIDVKVLDKDGAWISTSTFEYPAGLHPDGPGPIRTDADQVRLQLAPGNYRVSLTMHYRRSSGAPAPPEFKKDFEINVDEREAIKVLRP